MTQTENLGHLAWCALIALALARQEGSVKSPAQANLFLTRWLATAHKQRRFPRDIAEDVEWLLKQGRQLGVIANLPGKLDYLWRSCSCNLAEQNDLFRLTCAVETAKDMHWIYRLMTEREWYDRHTSLLNPNVNSINFSGSDLDATFDDNGEQIAPLKVRLTGNVAGIAQLFKRCGWLVKPEYDTTLPHLYTLMAHPDVRD